jgi:hypothetical protein
MAVPESSGLFEMVGEPCAVWVFAMVNRFDHGKDDEMIERLVYSIQ